jgi:hypothetical protein
VGEFRVQALACAFPVTGKPKLELCYFTRLHGCGFALACCTTSGACLAGVCAVAVTFPVALVVAVAFVVVALLEVAPLVVLASVFVAPFVSVPFEGVVLGAALDLSPPVEKPLGP